MKAIRLIGTGEQAECKEMERGESDRRSLGRLERSVNKRLAAALVLIKAALGAMLASNGNRSFLTAAGRHPIHLHEDILIPQGYHTGFTNERLKDNLYFTIDSEAEDMKQASSHWKESTEALAERAQASAALQARSFLEP